MKKLLCIAICVVFGIGSLVFASQAVGTLFFAERVDLIVVLLLFILSAMCLLFVRESIHDYRQTNNDY